jgi:hypothetical protein
METLPYATVKPPIVVMVPLTDLFVPFWNPRKLIFRADQANLENHMKNGMHIPRLALWMNSGKPPWAILEGQRRYLAAQALGWKEIEAEIVDISLDEAKIRAITSNQGVDVFWLDKYESWESVMWDHRDWFQDIWADKFGVSQQMISRCVNLMKVLNRPARTLIRSYMEKLAGGSDPAGQPHQALVESIEDLDKFKGGKAKVWQPTESVAFPLTGFLPDRPQIKDKTLVARAQDLALQTIPVMLDRQFNEPQVKELVVHIQAGGEPAQFVPK